MWNAPNTLTLLRMLLIPVLVVAYYLPFGWAHLLCAAVFVLAAITDWLDGYLARALDQSSEFGAFLDPVADKLMVATALVLLATDETVLGAMFLRELFAVATAVIIGREIAISALREWMAEQGKRASVAVSFVGKIKTVAQMVAIATMLYRDPIGGISALKLGEWLLYAAAALTLWSMGVYLKAAWPTIMSRGRHRP